MHDVGTATMLQEDEIQGAMSGAALSLNAVLATLLAPTQIPWLVAFSAQA